MFEGKTKATIHLLTDDYKGGVLCLCDWVNSTHTVRDVLIDNQPFSNSITENDPPKVHPVLFESINALMIRSTAPRITGAPGLSGLNAACWRRLFTSYKDASHDLCQSLAISAQCLCTNLVDPSAIVPH